MQTAKTTTSPPDQRLQALVQRANGALDRALPPLDHVPSRLHEAMRYAVLGDGKRIRPLFSYAAAEALAVDIAVADASACAVELIHAYSLIHDDLPAMDDDDLRRGRPTCHRAFDEATAILAGDALQALAFEVLAGDRHAPADRLVAMLANFSAACGSRGMAGGQAIDLEAVGTSMDQAHLEQMHDLKTGALIRCALELPAISAVGPGAVEVQVLGRLGRILGLAFQIHDDVLDVEGDTVLLGKPQGSDQASDKPTFTSCIGLERSKALSQELLAEALEALSELPGPTDLLQYLARFTVERKK